VISLIPFWLAGAFLLGLAVGSFLNVCIVRLPLEKSLVWPGSRCGNCLQAVAWYDNIPVLSYLLLRGRCRSCGQRFSPRYLVVELLTGLGFAGLFYAEVVANIHNWAVLPNQRWEVELGWYPWQWYVVWGWHALLFSLLMVASVCDLNEMAFPFPLIAFGTVVGLIGSVLMPWPWPRFLGEGMPKPPPGLPMGPGMLWPMGTIGTGIYPWPVWGPIPDILSPGGNWQTGLATGIAGMLVGTFLMRAVSFVFSKGLGREALGIGDADLMMMAGAFLGWQAVVVAFFVSVFPALAFGAVRILVYRDNAMPFGPALSMGLIITWLCWRWIGPRVQPLLFWGEMLVLCCVIGGGFLFLASLLLRRRRPAEGKE
jgi:leader peptidase (prepilin peptidase)/N-methyltransferase